MARGQKNPKKTIKGNGVKNYMTFTNDSHPGQLGFPVEESYLKGYLTYKVKQRKVKASTLKYYISKIKAHNKTCGYGWNRSTFDPIIKDALDSLKRVDSSGSPNLDIQKSAAPNDKISYNSNDGRQYLSLGFNPPNFLSLPTGINSIIPNHNSPYTLSSIDLQPDTSVNLHIQSNQFNTDTSAQYIIPNNKSNYSLSSLDTQPNTSVNLSNQSDTQHIIPSNNSNYNLSSFGIQPDINTNLYLQSNQFDMLHIPNNNSNHNLSFLDIQPNT
ncbi:1318_t:CDS:1, partial [Racocetra persica]